MRDLAMRRFLERLATAAGIAAIPLVGSADTGEEGRTICVTRDEVECPDPATALTRFQDPNDWGAEAECDVYAVLGAVEGSTGECCYEVQASCGSPDTGYELQKIDGSGCMGRPFLEEGRVVTAAVTAGPGRLRGRAPNVEGLDPGRRALLARFWLGVALAEHASIAEFHRICLELMRHGAPASLLQRAQVAAVDEARHAKGCLTAASAYAGRPLVLGALPIAANVRLAEDLPELARATARDGCVAETCSAWLYGGLRDRAKDPVVRAILAGVVRDETRHAELAWATLAWAIEAGGDPVRRAAAEALAAPPPSPDQADAPDDPRLAEHGWAPRGVQDRLTTEAWRRVVLPLGVRLGCEPRAAVAEA